MRLKDKDDQLKTTEKILDKCPLSRFKAKMPISPFPTLTHLNILTLTAPTLFVMKKILPSFNSDMYKL